MAFFKRNKQEAETTPAAAEAPPEDRDLVQKVIDRHRDGGVAQSSDEGASCVADGTKWLQLLATGATDQDAPRVADYIATIHEPSSVDAFSTSIGKSGALILAKAAGANPNVWSLKLGAEAIGGDGMQVVADAIIANPNLQEVLVNYPNGSPQPEDDYAAINAAILQTAGISGIQKFHPPERLSPEAQEVLQRNVNIRKAYAPLFQNGVRPHLIRAANFMASPLGCGTVRWAGMYSMNACDATYHFQEFVRTELPRPTLDDITTRDALLDTPAYEGAYGTLRQIDNPHFWNIFPEAAAKLAAAGTPITKDFLMQPNPEGEPNLCNAIHAGKLGDVVAHLNAQGESITAGDLSPEIIEALQRSSQAAALFSAENLDSKEALRELRAALPENCLLSFEPQNLHALQASLGRHERATDRER